MMQSYLFNQIYIMTQSISKTPIIHQIEYQLRTTIGISNDNNNKLTYVLKYDLTN